MKSKRSLITFLIFFFAICSFSQETIDSLQHYVKLYNTSKSTDNLEKILRFFNRDKELYKKTYPPRASYDLYYIAKIEYKYGALYDSEKTAIEGLRLLDSLPFSASIERRKRSFYNHLGILRKDLGDYNRSLEYYDKSLSLCLEKKDSALAFNNIGAILIEMDKHQEAKEFLLKATSYFQTLSDSSRTSLAMSNLGHVKSKLGEKDGLKYLKESLKIRKSIDDSMIFESYKYLTEYYTDRNDTDSAMDYARKGYDEALRSNILSYKFEALSDLIELGANQYALEFKGVIDEQIQNNDIRRNSYAEAKYSVDLEKEKTREEREERVKAQAKAEWNEQFYGSLVVFSIIILFLVVLFLRARHKKNTLQKQFETEQRISKRLHDEVANDVFHIMSKLQSNKVNQDDLVDNLEDIYDKTRDLSNANSDVDVSEDFVLLLNDLLHSYKNVNVNIFTRNIFLIDWDSISNDKKKVLYRILQELMTNMKKHSDASLVTLIFHQENKKINIDYIDNGVGCDVYKGNGLRNAENRIELIGGKITFESELGNGFKAKIRI